MKPSRRSTLTANEYIDGVSNGDRAVLARAITLVESTRPDHQELAQNVLQQLLPQTGNAIRLGISGVPGVGKSTFIEALGEQLTDNNHRLAVLAIDPSSSRTGGSILGDKTRMQTLATHPDVYIRPSPTSGTLGGVARMTRETILLVEAAGFDRVVIESVGVGQSEITLADMVDFYLLLMLPGAGDELQGIKKGVLEVAHMIAVNKADPDDTLPAEKAASSYRHALHIMTPANAQWQPPVVTCSALHQTGIDDIWNSVLKFRTVMNECGAWQENRSQQQVNWMWAMIKHRLLSQLHEGETMSRAIAEAEESIRNHTQTPVSACNKLLQQFGTSF